jgi:hypothetical protein
MHYVVVQADVFVASFFNVLYCIFWLCSSIGELSVVDSSRVEEGLEQNLFYLCACRPHQPLTNP